MKLRKTTAALLALLLLLSAAAGCSDAPANTDDSTPAVTDAGAEETPAEEAQTDSRLSIPDDLPEITFDGREFRALTTASKEFQFRVDELNGEVTNDAIFNRNETICLKKKKR